MNDVETARAGKVRRFVAALFGAVLGGLASILLLLGWSLEGWPLLVPVAVGVLAGFLRGDRGFLALMRVLPWV